MLEITYIEHSGAEHKVQTEGGKSLMEVAMEHGVPGIDADCGGACACGTCHVIVDAKFLESLDAADPVEESMLSMTPERTDRSRLSCQIHVNENLDGLVVTLPEFQM